MDLPRRALDDARGARALGARYVDLGVEFTDGARRARYGGRWDRTIGEYVGRAEEFVVRRVLPGQFDVLTYEGPEPVRLVSGGIGAGKTTVGADVVLKLHLRHPGERAWWVAPIYRTAKVGWRKVLQRCPPAWVASVGKHERDLRITFVNGFTVDFRSAVHEETLESDDCRFIVGDEPGRFSEEVRRQLRERIIRNPGGRGWIYYTGTPTDDIEEMLTTMETPSPLTGRADGKIFHLSALDNTLADVDPQVYRDLAAVVDERAYARAVEGRLVKRPGRVFHSFEIKEHMRPLPDVGQDATVAAIREHFRHARAPIAPCVTAWAASADRGRPLITLVLRALALDHGGHAWWCADEIVSANATITEHVQRVRAALVARHGYHGRGAYAVVTSDQHELDLSEVDRALIAAGFSLLGDAPGKRAAPEQASADAVNGLLRPADGSEPRLYVDPRCAQAKRALQLLLWGAGKIARGPDDLAHADLALRGWAYRFNAPEYRRLRAAE